MVVGAAEAEGLLWLRGKSHSVQAIRTRVPYQLLSVVFVFFVAVDTPFACIVAVADPLDVIGIHI